MRSHAAMSSGLEVRDLTGQELAPARPSTGRAQPPDGRQVELLVEQQPASLTSRSRWMASCGTRTSGRSTWTSTASRPSSSTSRPDSPRSRSSQELTRAPP